MLYPIRSACTIKQVINISLYKRCKSTEHFRSIMYKVYYLIIFFVWGVTETVTIRFRFNFERSKSVGLLTIANERDNPKKYYGVCLLK